MKKLTGALVLSLSLLMASCCHGSGEPRPPEDPATPSSSTEGTPIAPGVSQATKTPIGQEAGGPTGNLKPTPGTGDGAMKQDTGTGGSSDTGAGGGKTLAGGSSPGAPSDAERQAQESCVDKFAKDKKLDKYGNAEGTLYAGGTPLFDERTGETRDRLDYFYERQPEAKKACAHASKEAPPQKKK
ncbi:MAG: hypothetical protein ACJ8AT_08055 [Hyalangium sp.]|uniref:hypothetical protein n=1 Tax=Hyalangium sp. TaxID=2028555 RepID=UPI00389AC07B